MTTFSFTLTLDRFVEDLDQIDGLYGVCKDASLETAAQATLLHFDREADTLDKALRSAMADVRSRGFSVQRIEVEPASIAMP